jgi:hypothetical protein
MRRLESISQSSAGLGPVASSCPWSVASVFIQYSTMRPRVNLFLLWIYTVLYIYTVLELQAPAVFWTPVY